MSGWICLRRDVFLRKHRAIAPLLTLPFGKKRSNVATVNDENIRNSLDFCSLCSLPTFKISGCYTSLCLRSRD